MGFKKYNIIIYIFLILIPLALYWQCTGFSFVWDDKDPNLLENRYLQNPTIKNILHFWTTPYAQMYIPLSYSVWALVKYIGVLIPFGQAVNGYNAFAFHFFNILFHILTGLIIFSTLRLLVKNRLAAFFGALLFLVHPLQVETVAWVTEFRGLLSAFFGFSALYIMLKSEITASVLDTKCYNIRYINAIILYLFGLFSKPSVVVIPLFLLLFYIFYFKKSFWFSVKKLIPFIVITIPFVLIVSSIQPASYHEYVTPLWARPLIWMDSINFYLRKLIIPYPLLVTYTRTFPFLTSHVWFYIEWILPLILLFFILIFSKKTNYLLLGFLIFLAGFLPVSGLIPFNFQKWSNVADRYIYFSIFGIAFIFSCVIKKYFSKKIVLCSIVVLLCLTLISAFVQIPTWRNSITLWSHALSHGRPNAFAYNNRGAAYNEMQEYEKSIQDLNIALQLDPKNPSAYNNRGFAFSQLEKGNLALSDYNTALQLAPDFYDAYINRGNILLEIGDVPQALDNYKKSISINSNHPKSYYNLGKIYAGEDSVRRAIGYYNTAIELSPGFDAAYLNRGIAFAGIKQYDKALQDYNFVIEHNPYDEMAYSNRGIVYLELCEFEKAEQDFSRAIELNPKRAQTYLLRGKTRKLLDKIEKALEDCNKALDIDPKFVDAYIYRGIIKSECNNIEGAIKDAKTASMLMPDNVKALTLLGDLYSKCDNFSQAELFYSKAISLNPEDGSLYQKRAVAYFFLEDYDHARQDVQKALELGVIPPNSFLKALNEK